MRPVALSISALLFLTSCTVKSDRTGCPCFLDLTLSGGAETDALVYMWDRDGVLAQTCRVPAPSADELEIPKATVLLGAVSGMHNCAPYGTRIMVPEGQEMDEIYCFSDEVDARRECVELKATLRKEHAFLHIIVSGSGEESYPYFIRVSGNVCGLDLKGMKPVPGSFSVVVHPIMGEYHRICLPRQTDSSLLLELFRKDGTHVGGDSVPVIPIGQYIAQSGYDWTQENLEDIYVDVDYVRGQVGVDVVPWKEEELQ